MVYKFFDKKSIGSGIKQNQQLANELHKLIITKFKRRLVYSSLGCRFSWYGINKQIEQKY